MAAERSTMVASMSAAARSTSALSERSAIAAEKRGREARPRLERDVDYHRRLKVLTCEHMA